MAKTSTRRAPRFKRRGATLYIRLDLDIVKGLDALAKRDGRTRANLMAKIVTDHVEEWAK